jgi:hypothetical protein
VRCRDGRTLSTNFSLCEVSTATYGKQQIHLLSIVAVVDHGVWPMDFNDNKNRLKQSSNITIWLVFYLIYLTSISWIACNTVLNSQLPWSTWPWRGNFYIFKKEATRQQSTEIKLHRLLVMISILRLVPRDCWLLVLVLGQNECSHGWSDAQRFCCCCSIRDA